MWYNVYLERKANRENRPELLEFVKKYSWFLLIFSYVFGSLSGIGIWYAARVANPRGISGLIHNYVWGWATEWVFFIIEVIGIFIYYYTMGRVDKRTQLFHLSAQTEHRLGEHPSLPRHFCHGPGGHLLSCLDSI
jgi:hypothetical protein